MAPAKDSPTDIVKRGTGVDIAPCQTEACAIYAGGEIRGDRERWQTTVDNVLMRGTLFFTEAVVKLYLRKPYIPTPEKQMKLSLLISAIMSLTAFPKAAAQLSWSTMKRS